MSKIEPHLLKPLAYELNLTKTYLNIINLIAFA